MSSKPEYTQFEVKLNANNLQASISRLLNLLVCKDYRIQNEGQLVKDKLVFKVITSDTDLSKLPSSELPSWVSPSEDKIETLPEKEDVLEVSPTKVISDFYDSFTDNQCLSAIWESIGLRRFSHKTAAEILEKERGASLTRNALSGLKSVLLELSCSPSPVVLVNIKQNSWVKVAHYKDKSYPKKPEFTFEGFGLVLCTPPNVIRDKR